MGDKKPDFQGYASKANVQCSDGRTIEAHAFKHQDGLKVPLVWSHSHDNPENVLGHVILENREDGLYCKGYFNRTAKGQASKILVEDGNITSLSIYANKLLERAVKGGKVVLHGMVREVSLVIAGANPEATIEPVSIEHGDGSLTVLDDAAVIHLAIPLSDRGLEHGDDEDPETQENPEGEAAEGQQTVVEPDATEQPERTEVDPETGTETTEVTPEGEEDGAEETPETEDGPEDSDDTAVEHADGEGRSIEEIWDGLTDEKQSLFHYMITRALASGSASHADTDAPFDGDNGKTVQMVYDTLVEDEKGLLHFMIEEALDASDTDESDDTSISQSDEGGDTLTQSDNTESETISGVEQDNHTTEGDLNHQEGNNDMRTNVFEKQGRLSNDVLAHAETVKKDVDVNFDKIVRMAKEGNGSFKEAFMAHAGEAGVDYGITDIDVLFPDARSVTPTPELISRQMGWVDDVINATKHSPFSRIKSFAADLTADQARAKGYVKGQLKKEEVIKLLKRVTTPTTIYKKQKLDRDDIVDITDIDVVAWLKAEMRLMLNEEIARAVLLGDGREPDDDDKVDEDHIRPIAYDHDMYAHKTTLPSNHVAKDIVEAVLRARKNYRGSGSPAMYTTDDILTDLMLQEDKIGRRLYDTEEKLAAAMRVSRIVVVEPMADYPDLVAIIVNLVDYTIGADRGGNISMFDDFDIDYNQYKYLIETRISGALTKPKSALVIRKTVGTPVVPQQPAYDPVDHEITIPSVTGVEYRIDGQVVTGVVTIEETTEVEAYAKPGYSFAHNTDTDWIFSY